MSYLESCIGDQVRELAGYVVNPVSEKLIGILTVVLPLPVTPNNLAEQILVKVCGIIETPYAINFGSVDDMVVSSYTRKLRR